MNVMELTVKVIAACQHRVKLGQFEQKVIPWREVSLSHQPHEGTRGRRHC